MVPEAADRCVLDFMAFQLSSLGIDICCIRYRKTGLNR